MNRTSASRGVLMSLALVAVGLAALIWWLFASGRFEAAMAPTASKTPASESKSGVAVPAPEKPAPKAIVEAKEALKDLGDKLVPQAPASADSAPAFDVARVDPDGEAVIAGRAAAGSLVELLVNGQVHDRTTADSSGAFVHTPKPLPPGNYDITLRATAPDGKVTMSKNAVAVALRATDRPVAALAAPNVRTAAPTVTPPSLPQAKPRDEVASRPASKDGEIRIVTIEPEAGGGLFVSGRAAPGSRVRLYMNDGYIAMGTASPEGLVSFSIRSGVKPGDYRIRLDQMSASDSVTARVEVPFRAPTMLATPAPSTSTPPQMPASPAAPETVVASPRAEPAAPAAIALAPQPQSVANDKPALPAAPSSEPSPSQRVASGASSRDLAGAPAKEPLTRTAQPAPNAPSPVAAAQQAKPQAISEPAQAAVSPADIRTALRDKSDTPAGPAPVAGAPASGPKADNAAAPRVAGAMRDRSAAVVIPSIDTRSIVRGDNLWRISQATYGLGQRYTVIFGANRDKIRNPDLIFPGQIFVLPRAVPKQ